MLDHFDIYSFELQLGPEFGFIFGRPFELVVFGFIVISFALTDTASFLLHRFQRGFLFVLQFYEIVLLQRQLVGGLVPHPEIVALDRSVHYLLGADGV